MELACLPTTSDEERKRLLSFVVCGGGPTGVEFAAELFDLLNEDLLYSFPKILRNEISVHIIQSRSHILNTYDEALSKYAEVGLPPILFKVKPKEANKSRLVSPATASTFWPMPEWRRFRMTRFSSLRWKTGRRLPRRFPWVSAYGQLVSVSDGGPSLLVFI